jgi:hypothetical protein
LGFAEVVIVESDAVRGQEGLEKEDALFGVLMAGQICEKGDSCCLVSTDDGSSHNTVERNADVKYRSESSSQRICHGDVLRFFRAVGFDPVPGFGESVAICVAELLMRRYVLRKASSAITE